MRAEHSDAGSAAARGYPSPRAGSSAPRGRAAGRDDRDGRDHVAGRRAVAPPRVPEGRGPQGRTPDGRIPDGRRPDQAPGARRPAAPSAGYRDERSAARPPARPQGAASGAQLRGSLAVAGMFALTLVAAAADSYIGVGLGMITLFALLIASVIAGLMVRRRDLFSVVVAPPLVFVGVAMVNIALAPSASFNLPTLATLLIRGFPAMAIAVAAALVLSLGRLIARR